MTSIFDKRLTTIPVLLNNIAKLNLDLINIIFEYTLKEKNTIKRYHFVKYDAKRLFNSDDYLINVLCSVEAENEVDAISLIFSDENFINRIEDNCIYGDDVPFGNLVASSAGGSSVEIDEEKSKIFHWKKVVRYVRKYPGELLAVIDDEQQFGEDRYDIIDNNSRLFDIVYNHGMNV